MLSHKDVMSQLFGEDSGSDSDWAEDWAESTGIFAFQGNILQ